MSMLMIVVMTSIVLVVLKLAYPFGTGSEITPEPFTAYLSDVARNGG